MSDFFAKSFDSGYNASMDDQAVIKLYQAFAPKILRYLKKHLPSDQAHEILNDVFFEAIDTIATLRNSSNLQAWLYKIAHNKMVDYYRKKKIKSFLFSQVPYLELLAQEMSQPEFILEKDRIRDNIEKTLHELSYRYQTILRMHYVEEMPIKKIAIVLNLSPKATESLLFRARQHFIKAYERT